jgi:hypothetical protein
MSNVDQIHRSIQNILAGEEPEDCARSLAMSLAAVSGMLSHIVPDADRLIDLIAESAKLHMRRHWDILSDARKTAVMMHPSGNTKQ